MGSIFTDPIFTGDLISLTVGPDEGTPGTFKQLSFGFGAIGFPAQRRSSTFWLNSAAGAPVGSWTPTSAVVATHDFGDHEALADATRPSPRP